MTSYFAYMLSNFKSVLSIILFCAIISLTLQVCAKEKVCLNDRAKRAVLENETIKGGIIESKELPEDFYGTWSVSTRIIRSDNPLLSTEGRVEIWRLEKVDNTITLVNPITGARASITVDNVRNNTATFSRKKLSQNLKEYEKVTMTMDSESSFSGNDIQVTEKYRRGKLVRRETVEFQILGKRLSGPLMRELFSK